MKCMRQSVLRTFSSLWSTPLNLISSSVKLVSVLILVGYSSVFIPVVGSVLRSPEFAEPIKNVTLAVGSDVEFSCEVRHLGTYRVAWSWKKDEDQRFLGIGIVKITPNSRVHITKIQKSDDVTQFNLYVYSIKHEDEGEYHCSVNSNPMIEQIGTLDVIGDAIDKDRNDDKNGQNLSSNEFGGGSLNASTETETNSTRADQRFNNLTVEVNNGNSHNSTSLCEDLSDVWENAREHISTFLSTIMTLTYSYWLMN